MMKDVLLRLKSHGTLWNELGDADQRTDGGTEGRTDTPAHNGARTHLKKKKHFLASLRIRLMGLNAYLGHVRTCAVEIICLFRVPTLNGIFASLVEQVRTGKIERSMTLARSICYWSVGNL